MNKLAHTSAFLIVLILILIISPAKLYAQKTLTWSFNVPLIENVDSIYMQIIDNSNHVVFNDSVAVNGSKNNIPTSVITVSKSGFDVNTYGVGNKAKIILNAVYDQNVVVEMYDLTGRLVNQFSKGVKQGENLIDVDLSNYSSSQYIMRVNAVEGVASSRVTNVGGQKTVSTASVKSLEETLKSADGWKFIVSHPNLLTDTFRINPSDIMDLNADLYSRPNISGQVLNIFNMVGEDGKRKIVDDRFINEVGIEGMKVFLDGLENDFALTKDGGYFNLRPDRAEEIGPVILNDTLYIVNHLNSTDFYQFKKPIAIKSGELLDVNGKANALITMAVQDFPGLDYAKRPLTEDLLDAFNFAIEVDKRVYPLRPQYNGSVIAIDIAKGPFKVYLDKEHADSDAYADNVLVGLKKHEVTHGLKFNKTTDKDSAFIEYHFFDTVDFNTKNFSHVEYSGKFNEGDGWKVEKINIYLHNGEGLEYMQWVSAHELTHTISNGSDDGHSKQLNDIFGTRYELSEIKLSDKDRAISKLCLWPLPNPSLISLVKKTKYDK